MFINAKLHFAMMKHLAKGGRIVAKKEIKKRETITEEMIEWLDAEPEHEDKQDWLTMQCPRCHAWRFKLKGKPEKIPHKCRK